MKKANYKNWMPIGVVITCAAIMIIMGIISFIYGTVKAPLTGIKGIVAIILNMATVLMCVITAWLGLLYSRFSYNGKRPLSKKIIESVAEYVKMKDGETGLDVGCGSGALTIAVAKRNPEAKMTGIDRWGKEYASFSKKLCEYNAEAEGVNNVNFMNGDAVKLDFPDESFDFVTSNYVYHNISGVNKQELLLETLRVLKKGGGFAIHDIMSYSRYGDMEGFIHKLKEMGYKEARLIHTDDGTLIGKTEAVVLGLKGSAVLIGVK